MVAGYTRPLHLRRLTATLEEVSLRMAGLCGACSLYLLPLVWLPQLPARHMTRAALRATCMSCMPMAPTSLSDLMRARAFRPI